MKQEAMTPGEIGQRAFDTLTKYIIDSGHDIKNWCLDHGFRKGIIYQWNKGVAPSAFYLSLMCDLGFDITYILTGETSTDRNSSMVPVVRCKDCKFYEQYGADDTGCGICTVNGFHEATDDHFCSHGKERKM